MTAPSSIGCAPIAPRALPASTIHPSRASILQEFDAIWQASGGEEPEVRVARR